VKKKNDPQDLFLLESPLLGKPMDENGHYFSRTASIDPGTLSEYLSARPSSFPESSYPPQMSR